MCLMHVGLRWLLPAMFQKTDRGAPLHACLRGGQHKPIADGEGVECVCEYALFSETIVDITTVGAMIRRLAMPRETNFRTSILTCIIPIRKRVRRGPSWASQTEPERVRRLLESGAQQVPLWSPALADPAPA